jgi:endonuclease YncB( thermonuclease family)
VGDEPLDQREAVAPEAVRGALCSHVLGRHPATISHARTPAPPNRNATAWIGVDRAATAGHPKRAALLVALAIALGLAGPGAASANQPAVRPCPGGAPGTLCRVWTGKARFIADGDTLSVDVRGDGTRKPDRVRITGIQAMEEHVYTSDAVKRRGECHANRATARVEQLVAAGRRTVRLAAQNPASRSLNRLRRTVAVRIGGRWVDVGRTLVREGHALFLGNDGEWAWNRSLSALAQKAATHRLNLWNPDQCGGGPAATVRVTAFADPDGPDVDGEWAKVDNLDTLRALPLGGWWLRDSGLRRYRFPAGAVVPPGGTLTLWVGDGFDSPGNLFWRSSKPVFDNPSSAHARGDGAYLFDPDGDLRAAMQYPCRYACGDPYAGAVEIGVNYRHGEYVTLRNRAGAPIDLEDYRLESEPHTYVFGPDSLLLPGETMVLHVRGSPDLDVHDQKHWGRAGPILANEGDHVALTSLRFVRLGCVSWGLDSCAGPGSG